VKRAARDHLPRYYVYMTAVTIDLPDHVRDELAARAARRGRSLEQYLQEMASENASVPDPDEWWRQVRARARASGSTVTADDIVRTLREIRGE
jgi:antitoxin FitA